MPDTKPSVKDPIIYGTFIDLSTPKSYKGRGLTPPKGSGDHGAIALTVQAGPFKGWLRLTWRGVVNTYYYDTDTGWDYTKNEPSLYWKPSGGIPFADLDSGLSGRIENLELRVDALENPGDENPGDDIGDDIA
jgi:hypothetical protein